VTDLLPFVLASQDFLDKIESSLMAMVEVNRDEVFIIQRSPSKLTLTLAPVHGMYTFEIVEEQRLIRFVSPLSGGFSYVCDSDTGEWGGAEDGHRPEGILVRDLVRQVNGLPNL
jgi:Frataxin-like domain